MMTIRTSLGVLVMAASLFPMAACTGGGIGVRVYDGPHGDYHAWDAHEETVFRGYWSTSHRGDNRAFKQLNNREQEEYWNWRHAHPD